MMLGIVLLVVMMRVLVVPMVLLGRGKKVYIDIDIQIEVFWRLLLVVGRRIVLRIVMGCRALMGLVVVILMVLLSSLEMVVMMMVVQRCGMMLLLLIS